MKKLALAAALALIASSLPAKEVKDHLANSATLNGVPKKIVIHGILPLPSVFTVFNGGNDELIGMPKASKAAATNSLLEKFFPNTKNISTDFDAGKDINLEALLKASPDVVFHHAESKPIREKLDNAKIPAVGFSTAKFKFDSIDTFEGWLSLLGEVMEKEDKAKGIVEHAKEVQKELNAKLKDAPKKSAVVIFRYKNGQITGAGSSFFAGFWLKNAGLENGYKTDKNTAELSMEELYVIDPDMIFITNFTQLMPEDMKNPVDNLDFSKLKAVKNGQVFKYPLGMYRYYPPASEVPLVMKWMAKTAHPDLFKDMDIAKEMKDFYKRFYGLEITDEDVKQILNPPREAGDV